MGWAMILAGGVFIFLSKYKNMSDEDLHRSLSVMVTDADKKRFRDNAAKQAKNGYENNKE